MKITHIKAELKVKQPLAQKGEKEYATLQAKSDALVADVARLETQLQGLSHWCSTNRKPSGLT
jgi:hypothetical protein